MNIKIVVLVISSLLWWGITEMVYAQPKTPFTPIDQETWQQIRQALGEVPMSLTAHQQVQNILMSAERQAQIKAAPVPSPATPKVEPPKPEPKK